MKDNNDNQYFFLMDLILLLIMFMTISFVSIYNAQQIEQYGENFVLKQAFWFSLGIIIIVLVQFLDMESLYISSFFCYLGGIALLFILIISPETIAPEINNTHSWFRFGGITLQPSELVKITTIMYLASTIAKSRDKLEKNTREHYKLFLKLLIIGLLPVLLIILQPDFGTSMVFLVITGGMIFLSGINWKIIFTVILLIITFFCTAGLMFVKFPDLTQSLFHLAPYQMDRIETWLNFSDDSSNQDYHFKRSILAIGSGQLTGKGLSNSEVYIPEAQTDFIFSIIGESFGFLGCSIVVVLYFLLIYKLVTISLQSYEDNTFGCFLCIGYLFLIFIHTFQNIGMTIGIMPITGIPLLLISYGGSSILASMTGFALIYKVNSELIRNKKLFFK
ncbi:rod shape-determining protein RodA [Radiobacillus kanasensis]|uniref:FtsW/RodA/SpoVE family cell cycle protein n=1 Tax=Radiobacillus kanasensis TaxID=2844358 RepID=UPI001E59B5EE|nr:FtsW/RodA/SpoVE family cell cycle protein [Radiobacillus kanasensis]UFU00665.1 rod shape-determining protein RodA [Radiobacillus kanasensis]